MSDVILENRYAVVQKLNGSHKRCSKLSRKDSIVIEKLKFFPDAAFGEPFGVFSVRGGHLVRQTDEVADTDETGSATADGLIEKCAKLDDRTNGVTAVAAATPSTGNTSQSIQKLQQDEILNMKRQGTTGDEIIGRLVDGHKLMDGKTEYAKEKYIRRKHKKHGDRLLILRPTVRLLCDIFYHKDAERVCNLRADQLAWALSLADVRSGRRVLLVEQCQGLVAAAVLDRLATSGQLVHLHKGEQAQAIPCLHAMNFDPQVLDRFYPLPITEIFGPPSGSGDVSVVNDASKLAAVRMRKLERMQMAHRSLLEREMDCLVITVRSWSAKELLMKLIEYVAPSTSFVVYSPYVQPLLDCYQFLKEEELALNLQLMDSFYRKHQVLPDRTHPEMQQYVTGGYLLAGVTIVKR